MLNCKLGLSTNDKVINEELFKNFAEADIKLMEISTDYKKCDELDFNQIKAFADKYGVELWSFHLPFAPFDKIDISNTDLAEQTVELFKSYINKCNQIGIKVFIIHPSGEPIENDERKKNIVCQAKLKRACLLCSGIGLCDCS